MGSAQGSEKTNAVRLPDTRAAATEPAPPPVWCASQRYPITVKANVTELTAESRLPSTGFVAVARGGSTPTKKNAMPHSAAARNTRSLRRARSRSSRGPSTSTNTGLASSRNTALAAVVSLLAWTKRMVVAA